MVPAFGFSVGDFIAAIELTVKISKALRETGGASTECRLVIQDLRNLQQVLETLQCLKPAGGDLSHINAIRGMAIACLLPLREFAEKIDRSYGPISGARSSHHLLRRSGKSIQWSVCATEELAKFHIVIAAKVASIGLLLGVFNCQSLSTIENGSQITNTLLAQAAERRDSLHKELSQQATTHHGALSADITEARTQIKDEISSAEGEAGKRHDHLINRAEQHTNDLRALGHRMDRVYGDTCSNIKDVVDVVDVCFRARIGNEQRFRSAERRFQKLGVEIKSLCYQQQQTSSRVSSSLQAVFIQIQIVRAIGASLLGSLIPFSEKVLRYLRDNMQTNLETYALLLKIHADMPKKLGNGDLILFQDVLGRTKSLPYEYFRHWDIFESMLRCEFKAFLGKTRSRKAST